MLVSFGAPTKHLQFEPKLVATCAGSRVLGEDCAVGQGRPPPIWRVGSRLGINSSQGRQVGQGRISEECRARVNSVSQVNGEGQISCLLALGKPRGRRAQQWNNGICQQFHPQRELPLIPPLHPSPEN